MAEGVESSNFFCQKWIHNPKKWGYRHKFFENRITFVISRSLYFQKKCYVAAKWALIKKMNIEIWKRPIFVRFSKNLCLYPHFLGSRIHFWQKKFENSTPSTTLLLGVDQFWSDFQNFCAYIPIFLGAESISGKKFFKIPLLLPCCYWNLTNFGLIFNLFERSGEYKAWNGRPWTSLWIYIIHRQVAHVKLWVSKIPDYFNPSARYWNPSHHVVHIQIYF